MIKQLFFVSVAAVSLLSQASAQTFVSGQFDTTAVAVVSDAPPGFDFQFGLTPDTPVVASTGSIGATDVATAGAIGDLGVLTSSADVSASSGIASASGVSHFQGSFINTGPLAFMIDFTPYSFASGSGFATTSLFIILTSGGVTLFQEFVNGSQALNFAAVAGTMGTLDLTLTSEASAGFSMPGAGNASSVGLVSFASVVPEPSTWLLFAVGLTGLFTVVRPSRRT